MKRRRPSFAYAPTTLRDLVCLVRLATVAAARAHKRVRRRGNLRHLSIRPVLSLRNGPFVLPTHKCLLQPCSSSICTQYSCRLALSDCNNVRLGPRPERWASPYIRVGSRTRLGWLPLHCTSPSSGDCDAGRRKLLRPAGRPALCSHACSEFHNGSAAMLFVRERPLGLFSCARCCKHLLDVKASLKSLNRTYDLVTAFCFSFSGATTEKNRTLADVGEEDTKIH